MVGWSPPQLLDLSHLHDHHPSYILIVPQSAPHFHIISLPPTAPLVIRGSFPGRKEGEVLDPPGSHRWRILPNQQGFASNSPHSSQLPAAFLLSLEAPSLPAHPTKPTSTSTCPSIPNPCQLDRAFCLPPSNILSQTKTPCFPISGAPCQRPNMVGCNI